MNIFWLLLGGSPFFGWFWVMVGGSGYILNGGAWWSHAFIIS